MPMDMDNRTTQIVAAVALFLIGSISGCACSSSGSSSLPPELDEGERVRALKIGEQGMIFNEKGMEVLEIRGDWVLMKITSEPPTESWIQFGGVTACTMYDD